MSIALIGVMAMQYYFIRESFRKESQLFDEEVKASLATVANKIERKEILDFAQEQERLNQEKYRQDQERLQQKEKLLARQVAYQEQIKKLQQAAFLYTQRFNKLEKDLNQRYPNIPIDNSFFETYVRRKEYRHLIRITLEQSVSPDMTIEPYANV